MSTQPTRQTIAITGDSMVTRPLSVFDEQPYLRMRDVLRSADAFFTNFEANAHPYLDDPHAQRQGGGTYVTTEPNLLADLKWMGVNIVSCGSSHADDYGPKGILDTMRYLDQAGLVHAGSGRHLAEARAPAYLETGQGRVALVAATSQYNPGARAGDQRELSRARYQGRIVTLLALSAFTPDAGTLAPWAISMKVTSDQ